MSDVWIPGWQCVPEVFQSLWGALDQPDPRVLSYADAGAQWSDWVTAQIPELDAGTRLIGWSLGGMLAYELARRCPRVESVLVLNANTRFSGGPGLPVAVAESFRDRYRKQPETMRRKFAALVNPCASGVIQSFLLPGDHRESLNWLYDLDLRNLELTVPVSVLLSRGDQLVPCRPALASWEQTSASVTVIDGTHDACRAQAGEVAKWIRRHG